MEVNMSPNLTPAHEKYERNAVQYEQVIYNALQIVGGLRFLDLKWEFFDIFTKFWTFFKI